MENNMNMLKRKYRYTFQGKDTERNVIIPAIYCKINKRPSTFNYATNTTEDTSGDLQLSFFDIGNKFIQNFMSVKYGTLSLLDGIGKTLEEWILSGIKITSTNKYPSEIVLAKDDEIDCEINLTYDKCTWFNHTTIPTNNPIDFYNFVIQANEVHRNTMSMKHYYIPLNNNTEIGKQLITMTEITDDSTINEEKVLPLDRDKAMIVLGSIILSHTMLKGHKSDINTQYEKCQEIYQTIKELYPDVALMYKKDFERE